MTSRLFAPATLCLAMLAAPAFAAGGHGHSHSHDGETAYGKPGNPKKAARIVHVKMGEADGKMFFAPALITVKRGEQLRLKLVNEGELDHELVVATLAENLKHAEEMKKHPDMEHDDPNAKRLKPKAGGEILWHFTKAGEFDFSCLIPGHRDAGMTGKIIVK